jgi:large subunit ribosomal protein L4
LSSRNFTGAKVVTVSELNTYDILRASNLVLAESSIDVLNRTFGIS